MRKLANAALAFSAAIFATNHIFPAERLAFIAVLLAVSSSFILLLNRKWLRPAGVFLVFAAIGLICYRSYYQRTIVKSPEAAGSVDTVNARIVDYPVEYDSYCRVEVRLLSDGIPHVKALIYDSSKQLSDAEPGELIRVNVKLRAADTMFGESYDYYNTKGIFLKGNATGKIERFDCVHDIRTFPVRLAHFLSNRVEMIFPEDTATFMKSLMLGDKSDFYGDKALYLAMSRAGLMHIVAVSGMHVSFLVGLLTLMFGNGRRSSVICILFVWLFVLVTGAGAAAVRAGFMQTLVLLAPVLRRENDPITSLSLILSLILLFNPFAAKSISLQLSFGAMAGIICFSPQLYESVMAHLPKRRFISYLAATVSSSIGVMIFTVPLTAIHFGMIPILSVLTNIMALWAVSYCFCGGWISCVLSVVPILGKASAFVCSYLARYIFAAARIISAIPFSVLYISTDGAAYWLLLTYFLLLAARFVKIRPAIKYSAVVFLSALMLAFVMIRADTFYKENDTLTVLDVGQGECITAFCGDTTVVVDCGNMSNLTDAGTTAGEYLLSCGRDRVDLLLLTHLHEDHANGVEMLMEMLPVSTLVLPRMENKPALYYEILECAESLGTEVIELDRTAKLECGEISIEAFKLYEYDDKDACLIALLTVGELKLLATGDSDMAAEKRLVAVRDLSDVNVLVVGHHGSQYSSAEELLAEIGGGISVISVGYNTYGHPAEQTLDRLEEYGYTVFRTDIDGTIEMNAG